MLSLLFFLLFSIVLGTIPELRQADRDSFPEYLTGLTLVEFFSPNCYHCRQYKRVVRRIDRFIYENSESLHQMKLMQYNCKGGYYCQDLGLEAIPALRLYLNSLLLGTLDGVAHTDEVLQWILKLIRKNQRIIHQAMRPANAEYEIEVDSSSDFSSDEELETEGQDSEQPVIVSSAILVSSTTTTTTTPAMSTPLKASSPAATMTMIPLVTPVPTTVPVIPSASPRVSVTPTTVIVSTAATTPVATTAVTTTPVRATTPVSATTPVTPATTRTLVPSTTPHNRLATPVPTPTRMPTAVHHSTGKTTATPASTRGATPTPAPQHRTPTPTPKPIVSSKIAPSV